MSIKRMCDKCGKLAIPKQVNTDWTIVRIGETELDLCRLCSGDLAAFFACKDGKDPTLGHE